MSKVYSIEEIQRVLKVKEELETLLGLIGDSPVVDTDMDKVYEETKAELDKFNNDYANEQHRKMLAMERFQELIEAGKSVVIGMNLGGLCAPEPIVTVCSEREEIVGDSVSCVRPTISEAILNIKVEE